MGLIRARVSIKVCFSGRCLGSPMALVRSGHRYFSTYAHPSLSYKRTEKGFVMSRFWLGIALTVAVGMLSAFMLFTIGFIWTGNGNAVLLEDRFLNLQFLTGIVTVIFSLTYFGRWKRPLKRVLNFHFLIVLIMLLYFGVQYAELKNERQQVLLKYQEFRKALLNKDFQSAYELMSPDWRQDHVADDVRGELVGFILANPEDSIYSVHIYESVGRAEIVPNSHASWWFRPSSADSWSFEKVDAEWYLSSKNTNFYMHFYR